MNTAFEATSTVEVSVLVQELITTYEMSEDAAIEMVFLFFKDRGVTELSDTIGVATMTEIVAVHRRGSELGPCRARTRYPCQRGAD